MDKGATLSGRHGLVWFGFALLSILSWKGKMAGVGENKGKVERKQSVFEHVECILIQLN